MTSITNQNFNEILQTIQESKQKAYASVNTILVELYWNIGKHISAKVKEKVWGKGVVQELANFIKLQDPTIKGFSDKNLWRMKQFYEIYQDDEKVATLWRVLPWSHNKRIMSLKNPDERVFYLNLATQGNYSYRELERQITSSIFERTVLGNEKLSEIVKQLPQDTKNVFRDSYTLEFLDLNKEHKEKDLQKALIGSLKDFILELGVGFAFVGEEYKLEVGNDNFKIDLLFYHRCLNCLVAFELKIGKFKPSHLGQLEFYLEALDRDVKLPHENPSIGVLLCREKNDEVVKYALSRSVSPLVISDYETKLIPKKLLQNKLNEFYELLEKENE